MRPITLPTLILLVVAPLASQAVNTNPLGAMLVDVAANADQKFGIPFLRTPSFVGETASVSSGTVTVTSTVGDVTTEAHYLTVTSGTLEGSWYQVTGSTSNSVTVAEDLQNEGLTAGDTLIVRPFWTLGTLFPDGGDVPQSPDVFNPVATVQLNDPSSLGVNLPPESSYLYHDGAQGPEGWYDRDDLGGGLKGDTAISPETFITIRNSTGSALELIVSGSVPEGIQGNEIVSRSADSQDNRVLNPYPVDITLGTSALVSSGAVRASSDVFNPLDQVLMYDAVQTTVNPAPSGSFIYHDGTQGPAGWYDRDDLAGGVVNGTIIPASAAFVLRRASGPDTLIQWAPPLPYSL